MRPLVLVLVLVLALGASASGPASAGVAPAPGDGAPPASPPPVDPERPAPVEPRPALRPAREVLEELANARLWSRDDFLASRPEQAIRGLFPSAADGPLPGLPTRGVRLDRATLVTSTAGTLMLRVHDLRVDLWWDEVRAALERAVEMPKAAKLIGVDLFEVPPPSLDYKRLKKRVLRFRGDLRLELLGFDPLSLPEELDAQARLDTARFWLEPEPSLAPPLEAAIAALPPQCVVEKLAATTQGGLEVQLAGVTLKEAEQYSAKLAQAPEVMELFEEERPVSRRADTFIIRFDRKP